MKKILFTTLGFPGSGKTYFARRLARDLGLVHLNSDKIRFSMFKKPQFNLAEHKKVFGRMDQMAEKYLKESRSVIYDANMTKRKFRHQLKKIADKYGAEYALLRFKVPVTIALARISKRSKYKSELMRKYHRNVDKLTLLTIKREIEEPTKREMTLIIDALKPYKKQIQVVTKFLATL